MKLKAIAIIGVIVIFLAGVQGIAIVRISLKAQKEISVLQNTINRQAEDYIRLNSALSLAQGTAQSWYDKYQELKANPTVVEKVVYQDRIVEKLVLQTLSDWQSLDELTQFLKDDQTEFVMGIGDCEDYAMLLRNNAAKVGKYISLQRFDNERYVYETGKPWIWSVNVSHMMNSAIVGGRLYLIEPQTDEVWAKESLD